MHHDVLTPCPDHWSVVDVVRDSWAVSAYCHRGYEGVGVRAVTGYREESLAYLPA